MRRRARGWSTATLVGLALLGCAVPPPTDEARGAVSAAETRDLGGLEVRLAVRDLTADAADAALERGFAEAARLASLLLADRDGSEIDVLNRVPMRVEIELSADAAAAVGEALAVAERSDGAYDPTARGPLRKLWGLAAGAPRVPRAFEIDGALRDVDWTDIVVGESGTSASRYSRQTRVDLGAVAMGAVLDGALRALDAAGAGAGLASARGIWAAFGAGTDPWSLEVGTPVGPARLLLADGAVAVGRRGPTHTTADGHPIREPFDPRSGRPAGDGEWSLARAPVAAVAGGVAEALLVMGSDGPEWLASEATAPTGWEGAVVLGDGRRLSTPACGIRWKD